MKLISICLSILLLSGCVSIRPGMYTDTKFPATNPKKVQLLTDFPMNQSAYSVIGEFHTDEGFGNLLDDPLFQQRLKRKAASLGADAVVLFNQTSRTVEITTPGTSTTNTHTYGSTSPISPGLPISPTISADSYSTTTYTPPKTSTLTAQFGKGYFLKYYENKNQ